MAMLNPQDEIVANRFSKQEAKERLGRPVCSKVAIDGIPAGARGYVMQVDEMEGNSYELIVEWHQLVEGKRQHNWFSRDEYERCLTDV
jgi:hypothetical protein